jgi:hypothetical protein
MLGFFHFTAIGKLFSHGTYATLSVEAHMEEKIYINNNRRNLLMENC